MPTCERCGENYYGGSNPDFCGTCIFINGPLPEPRVEPAVARQPRKRKRHDIPLEEGPDEDDES